MFGVALLVLAIGLVLDAADATSVCYEAKICIHNGVERCGVDSTGKARRFLDSCDIKEFNCIYKTDYVKTGPEKCMILPPIENDAIDDQPPEVTKYWCWRASDCRNTKQDEIVCAKDIQMKTPVFKKFTSQCSVFKRNCASKTGFVSILSIVQNNHAVSAVEKDDNESYLVSQYYCHRMRSCKSPAQGPVCGYSQNNQYLADFQDECTMFKANCDGNGRIIFYLIEKEICEMKKKYDEEHKNEIFEWERIPRVFITPPRNLPAPTQALKFKFSQRVKLAL